MSADQRLLFAWYQQLFDAMPIPLFIKDQDGRYLAFNAKFAEEQATRLAGTSKHLLGTTDFDHMPAAEAELYQEKDREVMRGGTLRNIEEQLVRGDGSMAFFSTTKMPLFDEVGDIAGLAGFSVEYPTAIEIDEALVASERRFRLAMRGSRDGIWEYDFEKRSLWLNARSQQLIGRPFTDAALILSEILEIVAPESLDRVLARFREVVEDPKQPFDTKMRIRLPDGQMRTMHLKGSVLLGGVGRVVGLTGTLADVTESLEVQRRLRHQALHDDLTGLANRRSLTEHLDGALNRREPSTLLFCDLDDFKLVNDSLGHQVGDELLQVVARALEATVDPGDLVARLGGDEFAILTPHHVDSTEVAELAQNVLDRVGSRFRLGETTLYTSVSIGMVSLEGYVASDQLLRDADTAMYRAKERKGTSQRFRAEMRHAVVSSQRLYSELRGALDRDEFRLRYQPVVDSGRRLRGFEALLRWQPPGAPEVPPGDFLPLLERSGLIVDVGDWVMNEVFRQLSIWRTDPFLERLDVSINISRVELRSRDLLDRVRAAATAHRLTVDRRLIFEITETAVAADDETLIGSLAELRRTGARIALDDFGMGQSALSQLDKLPIDFLKIDRSFISRITGVDKAHPILQSIVQMANELDVSPLAEGVETVNQFNWLRKVQCPLMQGYYFDLPIDAAAVVDRCRQGHPEGHYGPLQP